MGPAAAAPPRLIVLDALGPGGAYQARRRITVPDVAGTPVAELSMVPKLYVVRAMSALRRARAWHPRNGRRPSPGPGRSSPERPSTG